MFESLMAKRYIGSQKRHTVLTVCSIAIAVALMVVLFTALATVYGCLRDIAYDKLPFHYGFYTETREQADKIAELAGEYGRAIVVEGHDRPILIGYAASSVPLGINKWDEAESRPYQVQVLLDGYLDNDNEVFAGWYEQTGGGIDLWEENFDLVLLDLVDDYGRFELAMSFALFYVFVLFLAMTVRLVIDTAFEVSSKERERQFGVLQSIGATPRQIVHIITLEGLMLSVIGVPLGVGLGLGIAYAAFRAVLGSDLPEAYFTPEKASQLLHFHVNPLLLLVGVVTGAMWVFFSAYGTGMRIIRMTPMQAISARSNNVKKVKKNSVFGAMFGWTGKLASRNNARNPKRFIITVLSLTLSIALFASVSVVVRRFRDATEEVYAAYDLFDFVYYFKNIDVIGDLGYIEPLRRAEENELFSSVDFEIIESCIYSADGDPFGDGRSFVYVLYLNEHAYDRMFDGKPPISYKELSESGGYIYYCTPGDDLPYTKNGTVSLLINYYAEITKEEYDGGSISAVFSRTETDAETGAETDKYYRHDLYKTEEFKLAEIYNTDNKMERGGLVSTVEVYKNGGYTQLARAYFGNLCCMLKDVTDYAKAVDFYNDNTEFFSEYIDNHEDLRKTRAMLSAVEIGAGFLNVMFAMIAIVNMVNILSTGILNRRGEIASLQCVGMTEKQLYKMTFVECLQYALSSGVTALILCEALVFFTHKMLIKFWAEEMLGQFVSYIEPIPRVLIAAAFAFGVALIASLIPLRGMRSRPLVEHIRIGVSD